MNSLSRPTRILTALAITMVAIPLTFQTALELAADATATPPTMTVDSGGGAPTDLAPNDPIGVSIEAPSPAGAVDHTLESTWESGTGVLDLGSISAPEGFDVEYQTGGVTWSATMPADASTITGLRALGSVDTDGYSAGYQTVTVSATGRLVAAVGGFSGSSGGDGWDVFFGLGRIYNVFHHNTSSLGIDCHVLEDSSKCWSPGGTPGAFSLPGYTTGARSTGRVDELRNRLWALVKRNSDSAIGFVCLSIPTSLSVPVPCAGVGEQGFVELDTTALSDYNGLTDVYVDGDEFWTKANDANSSMLCLDISQAAPCTGQPFAVTTSGYTSPSGSYTAGRIKGFDRKIYITSANSQFDCFDVVTRTRCTGSWPKTSGTFSNPIFAVTSGSTGSTILAVCTHNNASSCFDPAGNAYTYPSGLPVTSDAATAGWGDNANIGARYYYINGDNSFGCWDFGSGTVGTGQACAGYSQGAVLGNYVYAVTPDPEVENCIWSNADNGARITPFHATTGAVTCPPPPSPEIKALQSDVVPRMACGVSGYATSWVQLRVTTATTTSVINVADLEVTIKNSSGSPIPLWTDLDPGDAGTDPRMTVVDAQTVLFDLSTLSTVSTGARPEFRVVTPIGTADAVAALVELEVVYVTPPPSLCFELSAAAVCPAGTGIAGSGALSPSAGSIDLSSTVSVSATPTQSTATVTPTFAPRADCLGTVVGVAVDEAGDPVAGVPVSFKTGATTHATVNTNASGHAVFTNVYPFLVSSSELEFKSSSSFRPVSASAIVDLAALTAGNTVTGSAVTYMAAPNIPPPPPTTAPPTTVPATTPSTTTPTTVPAPTTTVVPVPIPDETGEEVLPDLEPGQSVVFDDGVPEVVEVVVEEATDLVLRGQDFELRLKGDCTVRLCEVVEENAREVLELDVDGAANVSGYGFKPGTLVHIWLFSDPIYLGSLLVLEDGTFEGSVDLLDVEWGEHTLQVNGISFDDQDRTANLGVRINGGAVPEAAPVQLPATGTNTVPWGIGLGVVVFGLGAVLTGRRRTVRA